MPMCEGIVHDLSPPSGTPGILMVLINEEEFWTTEEFRMNSVKWILCLLCQFCFAYPAFNPDKHPEVRKYFEHQWDSSYGMPNIFKPGEFSDPIMKKWRAADGRIHWGGSEMSEVWMGYVDGAVRSGKKLALEVTDALIGSLINSFNTPSIVIPEGTGWCSFWEVKDRHNPVCEGEPNLSLEREWGTCGANGFVPFCIGGKPQGVV